MELLILTWGGRGRRNKKETTQSNPSPSMYQTSSKGGWLVGFLVVAVDKTIFLSPPPPPPSSNQAKLTII